MARSTPRRPTSRAPTEIDQQIGRNLRALRVQHNMTLAELGTALGISHQQLQKYETGTNRLSAGMLWKASEILGIDVGRLFEGPATVPASPAPPLRKAQDECRMWIDRTHSLKTLKTMAKALKALANET